MGNKFEDNIFGLVPKEDWLEVGWTPVTRANDPVDTLFGDTKTDNITAKWQTIASEYQIPVMAQFHGYDTEALTTFRVPVDNQNIEKGLIKVKLNQSERMRALLRSGVREDAMYDYVINDGIRLADQVITRTKVAKNELLATGKISIVENNLKLFVDYGVPAENTQFTLDLSATADIALQIRQICDKALAKGVYITGMVTSRKNILKMRQNTKLQIAINGNIAQGILINQSALKAFFEEEFGIGTIITSDQTYGSKGEIGADGRPDITTSKYFPEGKVTFFASNGGGKLGVGLWGDPPEVDDFEARVNTSGQSPYVYITQWFEKDPHVLWTKASGLFMPVLYNPYSLYIADVSDDTINDTTVAAETNAMFDVDPATVQTGLTVANGAITGTLNYISSGTLADVWGAGYFMGLKFTAPSGATSVKVGLQPSESNTLATLDSDMNGYFKVTDKNNQLFVVITSDGLNQHVQKFSLAGLTLGAVQGA